jgi:hypothetical protein
MAIILRETLTGNGSTSGANIVNPNNGTDIFQTVSASGTFGSGTLTIEQSVDGGSTWFDVTDSVGTVTFTADGAVRTFLLGNNDPVAAEQIQIRGTLAGSTSPSLTVVIADCR